MNILLDKLLALAIYPLGLSIFLILAGITLGRLKQHLGSTFCLVVAVSILWIFSMPLTSRYLLSTLEEGHSGEQILSADVAIVLGGIMRGQNGKGKDPDLTDAADRVVEAFHLFRDGRVKNILVTGGNLPWSSDSVPEAQHIADLLSEWGTPNHIILVEKQSRNTWENALNSKKLWDSHGFNSGFLVTSASHMPRALAVFRRAGFSVVPAATDFRAQPLFEGGVLAVIPDAEALENSTSAIKEWIGRLVYRLRGWT